MPRYTQGLDGRGSIQFRDIDVLFSSVITFIVQTSPGSIFDMSPSRRLVVVNIQFLSCVKYSISSAQ